MTPMSLFLNLAPSRTGLVVKMKRKMTLKVNFLLPPALQNQAGLILHYMYGSRRKT
jgi:hypothetical protein